MNVQQRLWEAYKKEIDSEIRERLLMIIWSKEGISLREIGRRLNCPHSKVIYWYARFKKEGLNGLKTRPRPGKPSKLTKVCENQIRQILSTGSGWQTKTVKDMIYQNYGITYSQRHVVRLFHRWGFELITPRKKHPMADKKEQLEFKKKLKPYWIISHQVGQYLL